MSSRYDKVVCGGMDVHYKFSKVAFRDAEGRVVARERLDHTDRRRLLERLGQTYPTAPHPGSARLS
ncbi:MAG: hypothetical protein ACYS1C_08740 [Planctomycetota bacterium]|jgi:hypothetical protein